MTPYYVFKTHENLEKPIRFHSRVHTSKLLYGTKYIHKFDPMVFNNQFKRFSILPIYLYRLYYYFANK